MVACDGFNDLLETFFDENGKPRVGQDEKMKPAVRRLIDEFYYFKQILLNSVKDLNEIFKNPFTMLNDKKFGIEDILREDFVHYELNQSLFGQIVNYAKDKMIEEEDMKDNVEFLFEDIDKRDRNIFVAKTKEIMNIKTMYCRESGPLTYENAIITNMDDCSIDDILNYIENDTKPQKKNIYLSEDIEAKDFENNLLVESQKANEIDKIKPALSYDWKNILKK
jgi:hypothetical protein